MCGITGMVGRSKNPEASFKLMTALVLETERRGRHATGHYAVGADGRARHFKAGIRALDYVLTDSWSELLEADPVVAMVHNRHVTRGNADNNLNNHPHVSRTGNLAVVHNGTLALYDDIREEFELRSECDSEIILKIIARTGNVVEGIKAVYAMFGATGDFACEVVYRNPKTAQARLFFFRDAGKPGRFVDATAELGQVFFFSQNEIWRDAISEAGLADLLGNLRIEIVPAYQIWIAAPTENGASVRKMSVRRPIRKRKARKAGIAAVANDSVDKAFWTGLLAGGEARFGS